MEAQDLNKHVQWVIKVSKLCNLRCSYCYEFEELHKKERWSFGLWRKFLVAAREYHDEQVAIWGKSKVRTTLIWHGGEPLILPVDYMEAALSMQREIFGAAALESGEICNAVQSNLYKVSDEHIELLKRHQFLVGVSFDVIPGLRRSIVGRDSEGNVLANIDRLRAHGIELGGITVLARHTLPHITKIYDFYLSKEMSFRILPLFDGPRPQDEFGATSRELAEALCELFVHWMDNGMRLHVNPLAEYFTTTIRKMLGVRERMFDRRKEGECVVLVNTDGRLYEEIDAYDPRWAFGDLNHQTIGEILRSPVTMASFERDERLRERHCTECPYAGACNGYPLQQQQLTDGAKEKCGIPLVVQSFIEQYLQDEGFTPAELRLMLAAEIARRNDELKSAGQGLA